jgi:DNA-binding PadR family transcriptional regulator
VAQDRLSSQATIEVFSIIWLFTSPLKLLIVAILQKTKKRILRALSVRRLHGYELSKLLHLPVTGIYQHLRSLSEDGLVVSERIGRKKVYSLTPKGETLLSVVEDERRSMNKSRP